MQMLEFTIVEPVDCADKKILVNPVHVVSIVEFDTYTEVTINGGGSSFHVKESYTEIRAALTSI